MTDLKTVIFVGALILIVVVCALTQEVSAQTRGQLEVLGGVAAGDKVRFTLKDTPELTRLIHIEKIAPERLRQRTRTNSAVDFELSDLSGRSVKLSDYRGKVVLVNF